MGRKKLNNAVLYMRVPSDMLEDLKELLKAEIKKQKK
jgi:hypothetical protein